MHDPTEPALFHFNDVGVERVYELLFLLSWLFEADVEDRSNLLVYRKTHNG